MTESRGLAMKVGGELGEAGALLLTASPLSACSAHWQAAASLSQHFIEVRSIREDDVVRTARDVKTWLAGHAQYDRGMD